MLDSAILRAQRCVFGITANLVAAIASKLAHTFLRSKIEALHKELRTLRLSEVCRDRRLLLALVAGEDHRFFSHQGVDPVAVVRALVRTCSGRLQGGSSVEQQLVRTLNRDYRICVSRKLTEMLLATTVSDVYSKEEVAQAYLSVAYFGPGIRGVQAALKHISVEEAADHLALVASIVAHLKYPLSGAHPDKWSNRRTQRSNYIEHRTRTLKHWIPKTSRHPKTYGDELELLRGVLEHADDMKAILVSIDVG